ncbi:acyltransferase family protein [Citrobacter koseri]
MTRRTDIDIYRGLGILLVVLGHVSFLSPSWHKIIYSFHMPAFFILSGYLVNVKNLELKPWIFIIQRFYRLIIPAWTIGVICGLPFVAMLLMSNISGSDFLMKLYGTLTGATKVANNFFVTPIWFLYCLFIVEAMFYLIMKISSNKYIITLIVISFYLIAKNVDIFHFFNVNIAFIAMPYFLIGYILQSIVITRHINYAMISVVLLLGFSYLTPTEVDMSALQVGNGVWAFINLASALAGSYLLYYIAGYINSEFISWLGKNTLVILGFNYYINAIAKNILTFAHMEYYVILSFIIQIILLAILVKIIACWPALNSLVNGKMFVTYKEAK